MNFGIGFQDLTVSEAHQYLEAIQMLKALVQGLNCEEANKPKELHYRISNFEKAVGKLSTKGLLHEVLTMTLREIKNLVVEFNLE